MVNYIILKAEDKAPQSIFFLFSRKQMLFSIKLNSRWFCLKLLNYYEKYL